MLSLSFERSEKAFPVFFTSVGERKLMHHFVEMTDAEIRKRCRLRHLIGCERSKNSFRGIFAGAHAIGNTDSVISTAG
jgi:hypothetical protein